MGMDYIGTSGWSYPSGFGKWNGIVYPRGDHGDELSYYAERFPAVEVNVSFYRIPAPAMVRGWLARTPPGFRFAVKLYRKFTHPEFYRREEGLSPEITAQDVAQVREGFDLLAAEGRLGAVLVQYPEFFTKRPETLRQLQATLETFREYPLAVELRHESWDDLQTAHVLASLPATRARIDEPFYHNLDLPPGEEETCQYWRFHGRNAEQWRKHGVGNRRYDYYYSAREVDEIAQVIEQQAPVKLDRYLFFNNHTNGSAVANAISLANRLHVKLPFHKFAHLTRHFPDLQPITGTEGGQMTLMVPFQ